MAGEAWAKRIADCLSACPWLQGFTGATEYPKPANPRPTNKEVDLWRARCLFPYGWRFLDRALWHEFVGPLLFELLDVHLLEFFSDEPFLEKASPFHEFWMRVRGLDVKDCGGREVIKVGIRVGGAGIRADQEQGGVC